MDDLIVTIQLALLLVLPLILFYQRLNVSYRSYVVYVVLLYSIWFATYALLHESSHLFGSWITGARIRDYQLVPEFWKGDYKTGYVNAEFENGVQSFVSHVFPYVRDLIFVGLGYAALKRRRLSHPFVCGLIIVLFVLSPLFDIVNNYLAFVLGGRNDFHGIAMTIGRTWAHAIGLAFAATAGWVLRRVLSAVQGRPVVGVKARPA